MPVIRIAGYHGAVHYAARGRVEDFVRADRLAGWIGAVATEKRGFVGDEIPTALLGRGNKF